MHRCSCVHVCKLRSALCFWKKQHFKLSIYWTFPISAMQYFVPEVVFMDQCIPNMHKGDITGSLFSYISFRYREHFMNAMSILPTWIVAPWTNPLFWGSVEWNIISGIQWSATLSPGDSEKTTHKLSFFTGIKRLPPVHTMAYPSASWPLSSLSAQMFWSIWFQG